MKSKEDKIFEKCLEIMFLSVGEKYPNNELLLSDNWYEKRSWTEKEEEKFKKWMVSYIHKKLRLPKKLALIKTEFFILQFGWTHRQEKGCMKFIRR